MLDKFIFGVYVTVICMTIVFLVLIGLSFIISIQRAIVEKFEGKSEHKVSSSVQEAGGPIASAAREDMDDELVAVISAAVAAVLGRQTSGIIVRSIRRLEPETPSWALAGRQEQMSTRF